MKGLLLKDYYVVREVLYIQLILLLFIGAGMSFAISSAGVPIIISIMTLGLCTTASTNTDKNCKWDMFSRTAPLPKNAVVSSKYIQNILLVLLGMILGIAQTVIITSFTNPSSIVDIVVFVLVGVALSLLSSSVNIPASILFDGTKQVLAMLLSIIFTTIIFIVTLVVAKQFIDLKENMLSLTVILASISVVLYVASWIIAPKLLSKRDL